MIKKILLLFFISGLQITYLVAQPIWPSKEWATASPKELGLNVDTLASLDAALASGQYGYIDGMLVIRHGKIAYQKIYQHDYSKIYGDFLQKHGGLNGSDPTGPYNYYNAWWHPWYHHTGIHTLQSVTKTITSVIIGIAITNKEFPDIQTPVLRFYDTSKIRNIDDRKRRMTIRHLLTMTAGIQWDEQIGYDDPKNDCSVMEASYDWVDYVINKPMSEEPGTRFNYNSGASELLADIFRKATGRDIEEYAFHNLFMPLGIEQYYWKRTPKGLIDTEGGLYLGPTDLAKIFYLYLMKGEWKGKQLVDPDWVKQSVTPAIKVGGPTEYGYKWWLYNLDFDRPVHIWGGSGFGGQIPLILPDYDMIVVFNGWNIISGKPSLRFGPTIRMLINSVEK